MELIQTLKGIGKLQEFNIMVRYSITISPEQGRPTKRSGLGTLETVSGDPLPELSADQQTVLTLEDGRRIKIEFYGRSQRFEVLSDD